MIEIAQTEEDRDYPNPDFREGEEGGEGTSEFSIERKVSPENGIVKGVGAKSLPG